MTLLYHKIILFLCLAACKCNNDTKTYDGAQVWRTYFKDQKDYEIIELMNKNKDITLWTVQSNRADYLVQPDNKVSVHKNLTSRQLNHTVLVMDVQRRADMYRNRDAGWRKSAGNGHHLNWNSYPTLKVIEEYMDFLIREYPSLCKIYDIGTSVENRTIKMLMVSNADPANQVILLVAGLHAREWAAVTSLLYTLNEIVTSFDTLPDSMKNKDWYIIPVLNPDGYEYSHTVDRLWHKNRGSFGSCIGVDLNRNFATDWVTAESNKCDDSFSGPSPFSERETVALRDVITNAQKNVSAFVDFHSYGQSITFPWTSRADVTPDLHRLRKVSGLVSKAILNATNQVYKHGSRYHVKATPGAALDWAYSAAGIKDAYIFDSCDRGGGFLMPADQIHDCGREALTAVKALAKAIETHDARRDADAATHKWF